MPSEYDTQLAHLVSLAATPGWKEYAWSRAQELNGPGLYRGIADALKSEMQRRASSEKQKTNGE